MPTLATNSVVLDAVMHDMRIPVSNLTERAKIQDVVSGVYADICAKQDWWWLQRTQAQNTTPKIDTGTVSLTEDSTTITFSTAPQQFSANVSVAGYVLSVPGSTPDALALYRIDSHTSGATTATIDAAYTGATDAAAAYRLYRVSYALAAGTAKLLQVRVFGWREPLQRVGIEDINFLQQTQQQEGKPRVYSVFDFVTPNAVSSQRMLQLWPFPDQAYRLEIWYKHQQQGDTSTDLDLPMDFQQVLIYGALARGYAIFLNDLERSSFYQALFNDVIALMANQQREYASDHPGIAIDMRAYRNAPARGRGVRRSLGRFFDILPNVP